MALLIAPDGPLRDALRAALEGGDVRCAPFEHPDLFGAALGASAIVYAPSPPADPERMRRVLGAANAPGVTLLVVVRPPGDDFEPEERLMRRDGKPYVVLAASPGDPDLGAALRRALIDGALQGRVFVVTHEPPAPAPAASSRPPAPAAARPVAPGFDGPTPARPAPAARALPNATAAAASPAPPPPVGLAPRRRAPEPAPRGRWLWPAVGLAIAGGALASGWGVLSSGCSAAPRAATTAPAARLAPAHAPRPRCAARATRVTLAAPREPRPSPRSGATRAATRSLARSRIAPKGARGSAPPRRSGGRR